MARKAKTPRHRHAAPSGKRDGQSATRHASRPRGPAALWPLLLALAGMLVTGYLTLIAGRDAGAAFCSAGSGCDVVQSSAWSTFLGLPVALWGFGLYGVLAFTAWRSGQTLAGWRRMWRLSLLGVAVSLYLTAAGAIALQAFCVWCLTSLVIISALFVLISVRRPTNAPGVARRPWWIGNALLVVLVLGAMHVLATGMLQRPESPRVAALADHLQQSDVQYFGASWCSNCRRQLRLFGPSAERLPYIECAPNGRTGATAFACSSAGITAYPTWVINGERFSEVLEPERLAELSGFDWDAAGK